VSRFRFATFVGVASGVALLVSGAGVAQAPAGGPFDVRDAVAQFAALKHHGEGLGWVLPEAQGAPDPSNDDHYQGVARYPGPGAPLLYVTQRDNDDAVVAPGTDAGGYLLVARMGTRPPTGERMRSNLQSRAGDTDEVDPDPADTWVRSIRFDGGLVAGGQTLPAYEHPGGMAVIDDVLLMALDSPRAAGSPTGQLVLFDLRPDPAAPQAINALPLDHKIDNLGAIRQGDGSLLLWVNGDGGHLTRFYTTSTPNLRDPALGLTLLQSWNPASPEDFGSVAAPDCENSDWPLDTDAYQGSGFVRQTDGTLFLVMTRNTSGNPVLPECDLADLYRADPKAGGGFRLVRVASDHLFCNYAGAGRICNLAAAAGPYVSPSGELILYSVPHDDQDGFDPDYVRMAEFRHRDVNTEDSPLRLPTTDAGGPYQVDEGGSVQLSGSGGPPADRPWVELYDDAHFLDRSIVVDFDDRGLLELEDFNELDGFNDKTSSVRWRSPPGLDIELREHDHFGGDPLVLPGTGQTEEIADLDDVDFGDKTSSLRWIGAEPPPGSLSLAWDLDGDGAFDDSSSATPTFTATAQDGTVPVALQVSDASGHAGTDTATVTIRNVPPSVTITAPANGSLHQRGTPVAVTASFADPGTADTHTCSIDWGDGVTTAGTVAEVSGSGTCTGAHPYASGGSKAITVSVRDDDAAGTAAVTIVINSPPSCAAVAPDPASLSPANHELRLVTLSGATDPDGDPVTLGVTGVTQDEPVDGVADGNTAPDGALVPTHADQVRLRAERASTGDGRVYRVAFAASDGRGGNCTGIARVTVVKSAGSGAATDSGLVFDSLAG
jgi:hypothetical protein